MGVKTMICIFRDVGHFVPLCALNRCFFVRNLFSDTLEFFIVLVLSAECRMLEDSD